MRNDTENDSGSSRDAEVLSSAPLFRRGREIPYETIMRRICSEIRRGVLKPGQQLRLREELNREYVASSVTVQRAFNRLAANGFVVSRGRAGTFVTERPPNLFRVGVLFDDAKARMLRNQYRLSLATVVAEFNERDSHTLATYYDVGREDSEDRRRLLDDLRNDRLAGLIWSYPPQAFYPHDPLPHNSGVPSVFFCRETPYSQVRLTSLADRAMEELARLGGLRAAVLMHSGAHAMTGEMLEAAERHGLELRPHWLFGIDIGNQQWLRPVLAGLLALPENDRPDSLLVADDNLTDATVSTLVQLGAVKRFKLVFHSNFPTTVKPVLDAPRVGHDCRRQLRTGLEVLDRLAERERAGLPFTPFQVSLPACVDQEVE